MSHTMRRHAISIFALLVFGIFLAAGGLLRSTTLWPETRTASLGQSVYIREGCIHCHSQYSRPVASDAVNSGPLTPPPFDADAPILIGNRRQGPDLSNIGARRSREWNRLHLIDPQALSPGSRMPRYPHLFREGRDADGEALLDYLSSLTSERHSEWQERLYVWRPQSPAPSDPERGAESYHRLCAQCHGQDGRGGAVLASSFSPSPPTLASLESYRFVPAALPPEVRRQRLAQLVKYGQPGTSMPGHEYLTDSEINDLVSFLEQLSSSRL